jgi:hypothetical protein
VATIEYFSKVICDTHNKNGLEVIKQIEKKI